MCDLCVCAHLWCVCLHVCDLCAHLCAHIYAVFACVCLICVRASVVSVCACPWPVSVPVHARVCALCRVPVLCESFGPRLQLSAAMHSIPGPRTEPRGASSLMGAPSGKAASPLSAVCSPVDAGTRATVPTPGLPQTVGQMKMSVPTTE